VSVSLFFGAFSMMLIELFLFCFRQQAISSLTRTPSDMFQGNGDNFTTFGISLSFSYLLRLSSQSAKILSKHQQQVLNIGQTQIIVKMGSSIGKQMDNRPRVCGLLLWGLIRVLEGVELDRD
jgi:hypothetical protein